MGSCSIQNLNENNSYTRDELSTLIGVSSNAIKQHLAQLKMANKIRSVGSTKSGYLEVLDD